MSGYIAKIGSGACVWGSRKQHCVGLSLCEAEYHAISESAKEIAWIRRLLNEVAIGLQSTTPMFSINQSVLTWVSGEKSPSNCKRSKHVDIHYHYIWDMEICFNYVPSESNDANVLTKPFKVENFRAAMSRVGTVYERSTEKEC